MNSRTPRERVNLNPGTSARPTSNTEAMSNLDTHSDRSIDNQYSTLEQILDGSSEVVGMVWL